MHYPYLKSQFFNQLEGILGLGYFAHDIFHPKYEWSKSCQAISSIFSLFLTVIRCLYLTFKVNGQIEWLETRIYFCYHMVLSWPQINIKAWICLHGSNGNTYFDIGRPPLKIPFWDIMRIYVRRRKKEYRGFLLFLFLYK